MNNLSEKIKETMKADKPVKEGKSTAMIERVTARAPSQTWLWLAAGSIVTSIALFTKGRREAGLLVGLWPPTFLILGNYNKMVKTLGNG